MASGRRSCAKTLTHGAASSATLRWADIRMIEIARTRAIEVLSSFALPRARLAFSRAMHEEGAVTRCQDELGNVAFAPSPATDALVDRVLSLIAADMFARPGDFEGETICSGCGGIVMGRRPV